MNKKTRAYPNEKANRMPKWKDVKLQKTRMKDKQQKEEETNELIKRQQHTEKDK